MELVRLIDGVLVMAAIDGGGNYLPLPHASLAVKFEAAERHYEKGKIDTVIVANGQPDDDLPKDPPYRLIKAADFNDLVEKIKTTPHPDRKVQDSKMPATPGDRLFGRKSELAMLEKAWRSGDTNILTIVAPGKTGKTALIRYWLDEMGNNDWGGAERVYIWSFRGQSAEEVRQASGEKFIDHALRWFRYEGEPISLPWERGLKLAELVARKRTLLILDGLELLQFPSRQKQGKIKDQGLRALLRQLSNNNLGLCVVTTRIPLTDLASYREPMIITHELEHYQTEDDASLKSQFGKGTPYRGQEVNLTQPGAETEILQQLCNSIVEDPKLTRLPALFETDRALPLALAYVELRLAPRSPLTAAPALLEKRLSLTERLHKRIEARFASRRSPQEELDSARVRSTIILGAPGAGKSSLLRRIALDIAGGDWKHAVLPLFVEVRAYWRIRKARKDLTMLRYALEQYEQTGSDLDQIEALVHHANRKNGRYTILLVDGLDEIASDSDAVDTIYGELEKLSGKTPWIATARPAGLMRSLNEDRRFELVELDEEAIECLIDNWSGAIADNGGYFPDPDVLKAEILGSSTMRDMGSNPFLLTALCYLKSAAPSTPLPTSRIGIYETLLERISFQARRRHGDNNILSSATTSALSEFTFHLYDRPNGVMQIFGLDEWHNFIRGRKEEETPDFERQILPARLLTAWGEDDPSYCQIWCMGGHDQAAFWLV